MLSDGFRLLPALALALLLAPAARAQKPSAQTAPEQEDNYVTARKFQSRIFEVKNRDPQHLVGVLMALGSGFKGTMVTSNQDFKTITVRDFPENITLIEEAIRRLDTPEPSRPEIEFHIHLLIASNEESVANHYPSELNEVVKQLQTTLGYKNFSLMGSQVVRSKEGRGDNFNKGVADLKLANDTPASKNPVFYTYNIRAVSVDNTGAQARVQVEEFYMEMKVPLTLGPDKITYENVGFKNPVSLREGERVIVGTTSIADKSVIVVISASTTK
jgi:type II secretory pathway component GspD/PulD (secretin)